MFDVAWCDKYDFSVFCLLYFKNSLIAREHLFTYFYKKETFVTISKCVKIFEDKIIKQDSWTCYSVLYWTLGVGEWNHVEYNAKL